MSQPVASRSPMLMQAVRFVIVGIANTALTFATIWLLHERLGAPVWLASLVGYAVGALQGYLLSRYWTFAGGEHAVSMPAQVAGFIGVNVVCGMLFAQFNELLARSLPLLAATLIAAALVMPISFALNRWVVFRVRRP